MKENLAAVVLPSRIKVTIPNGTNGPYSLRQRCTKKDTALPLLHNVNPFMGKPRQAQYEGHSMKNCPLLIKNVCLIKTEELIRPKETKRHLWLD